MVKTLFNLCVAAVSRNELLYRHLAVVPNSCKQRLLEFFISHDQLVLCARLVLSTAFINGLTHVYFYSSQQLTDEILDVLARHCRFRQISIIFCDNVTEKGIKSITRGQNALEKLELRALKKLTSEGLSHIKSSNLRYVDLSSCNKIRNDGIYQLVSNNSNICCLYLNCCRGLSDQALYDIAHYLRDKLMVLQLDFLPNVVDPIAALFYLSLKCPNIKQLSLCRFFDVETVSIAGPEFRIAGSGLRDVDLYGNYFSTFPSLPATLSKIRLSMSGDEDVHLLVNRLQTLPLLSSVQLQLCANDLSDHSTEEANASLRTLIAHLGEKITRLHVSLRRIEDSTFNMMARNLKNVTHLALDVEHLNSRLLRTYFADSVTSQSSRLQSLKLCHLRTTCRVLFAIARRARGLLDLEASHIACVDDRFLSLLAQNCFKLKKVNFNGCRNVTDAGMAALARKCPLREVRIRATACTDKSIYLLAQFCPDLEWISHADFSGRPKFSDKALQCLRDSCIQRVIC